MKFEMTERDKKLLMGLALFVIIVGIGYWGIWPQYTAMRDIEEEIEMAEQERTEKDLKIVELPMLETDNAKLEEDIVAARAEFYPMMTSDEVDKMMTLMVLDYKLYAYDLSIKMPQNEATLKSYAYAAKQTNVKDSDKKNGPSTGIYAVSVGMRLGGEMDDITTFINDISKSDKKIRLVSYSYGKDRRANIDEEGSISYEDVLTVQVTLEIFMCEE